MPVIYQAMDNPPHYQVVIIGAGAAGITIARKLGAAGVRTALIEGGQYDLVPASQELYECDIVGHPYSTTSTRMRMFGGGTNCWGGFVSRLDADTFEPRNDLHEPYPGWPIAKSVLDPYFAEGIDILDLSQDVAWEPQPNPFDPFDNAMRGIELKELYWNQSTPTRFRLKYIDELESYPSLDVLMNHSLIDIETDADGAVTAAVFTTLDRENTYRLTADRYILACGGIENARLLLYFNEKNGTRYGNQAGMLGHYFMEHPELDGAQFVMMDTSYQHRVNNHAFRFFRPTRDWQLREHLPACILRMYFTHEEESREIADQLAAATNIRPDPAWRAGYIMMSFEQMPIAENRIALSDELDALGMPRTELHWRLKPEDYRAPRIVLSRFAEMMAQQDFGRVRLFDWIRDDALRPDPLWAKHHIGTTRMGATENEGVVDTELRLYGTKNLHVIGSSVFPTSGYENPTLPIVQLSLHFSDYLLGTLGDI